MKRRCLISVLLYSQRRPKQMLLQRYIVTIFAFALVSHCYSQISLENWFCGQMGISRLLSYNSMSGHCWKYAVADGYCTPANVFTPDHLFLEAMMFELARNSKNQRIFLGDQLLAQVNHCCALHDNCYDLQLGRHWCDNNFCDCLKHATEPDVCQATNLKCRFVKVHGQQAYHDAASYKEPPDFVKIFPKVNGTQKEFQILYEECPQVMLTIKSCSLMANLCLEDDSQEKCLFKLDECVRQAAVLQNIEKCHTAAKHIHGLLVSETDQKVNSWKNIQKTATRCKKTSSNGECTEATSFSRYDFGALHLMRGGVQFVNMIVGITILIVALCYFNLKRHGVNSSSSVSQRKGN
ncbi:hypothetical protein Y032_0015g2601 [Ancylostoma ceylanicum]|uniref:Uncharacterized protein n=1 Tax=Ancylostoma ceylanicum TaxID=53326 RepID=A0A016V7A9_9BILA|nr:hypothetical protein Y032_0015g2601 [Ancylostoma ceylanicum]